MKSFSPIILQGKAYQQEPGEEITKRLNLLSGNGVKNGLLRPTSPVMHPPDMDFVGTESSVCLAPIYN